QQLVRLATDVPLQVDWEGWRLQDWDATRLLALFREWGFRGFADQVRSQSPVVLTDEAKPAVNGQQARQPARQGELFPFVANVEPGGEEEPSTLGLGPRNYRLINTREEFKAFYQDLRKQKRVAVDLETTSLNPLRSEILGIAFCWQPGEAYYLALRGPEGE